MNVINKKIIALPNIYYGWPANHGSWQWGDEFLFGFLSGPFFKRKTYTHNITRPFTKLQARSYDGGFTWNIEKPNVDFEAVTITECRRPFLIEDVIIRVCGVYDHGGEECNPRGGFYTSHDRGKKWVGAFEFSGLEEIFNGQDLHCTSRTCILGDILFLSCAQRHHWGTDSVFCAKYDGGKFIPISVLPLNGDRNVMPSACTMNGDIYVATRRTDHVDIFVSEDKASTWKRICAIGETGQSNGNPPSLISTGNNLICAYGNRDMCEMRLSMSSDSGNTWKEHIICKGSNPDIGYPRLFKRNDNMVVCVFYWADDTDDVQHIVCSHIEL